MRTASHTFGKPSLFIFFMTVCLICPPLNAQDGSYEKIFTTENGLSHNIVFSMAQDTTGFLWFATWDGLSRFDGYEFHNYYHNPNDTNSIPGFSISVIKTDRYNNVWLLPSAPILSLYNRETDNFRVIHTEKDPVLSVTGVLCITISDSGDLWLGGDHGMAVYDNINKKFREINVYDLDNRKYDLTGIVSINFDGSGNVWISKSSSIYRGNVAYSRNGISVKIAEEYACIDMSNTLLPGQQHNNFEVSSDKEGNAWLVTNWGCQQLAKSQGLKFNPDINGEPRVNAKNSFSWYKYKNNIVVLTSGSKTIIPLDPGEIPEALTVDKNHSIWFCTINKTGTSTGLHRFDKTSTCFKHYLEQYDGEQTAVYAIAEDINKNLLIGTRGNNCLFRLMPDGKLFRLNVLPEYEAIRSNHIRSIIADSMGIWIGYIDHRLDYYSNLTRKSVNIALTEFSKDEPLGYRTLYKDYKGNLLIGTLGLYLYDHAARSFKNIWMPAKRDRSVLCIRPDKNGILWAGSSQVIVRLRSNYSVDTIYTVSDGNYSIEDICFDDKGNLWLALMGGGLEKFDPATGKRQFFTTAEGLSNNTTYSILKDSKGNLWISTDRGISRFNPVTQKFRTYDYTDGLRIQEFNSDASYQAADGKMFFGGMGGVVSFYPDSIIASETDLSKCRFIITDFSVSGISRVFDKPVYEMNYLKLAKGEDNFGLTFACMNFRNPDKIQYRYRLPGFLPDWIMLNHQHRHINIAGLNPGIYKLELESTDILGNWNNRIELAIEIPPFFYQTLWFTLTLLFMGAGLIITVFIFNNRQIRIKEKQKHHYLILESIRGQMNPHFIFNSLNSINYFIAKSDRLAANRYIANFSKLIRSFLNNMAQDYIPLEDEVSSVRDYMTLEYLRFGDKFHYEVSVKIPQEMEQIEVFPGMVQPFIENAIWHGVRGLSHKGFISIVFSSDGDSLQCTITDNGIGRKMSEINRQGNGRKSRGISLIKERMQIINHLENKNYKIQIEDLDPEKKECGTIVTVDIPYKNLSFKTTKTKVK